MIFIKDIKREKFSEKYFFDISKLNARIFTGISGCSKE